MDEGPHVTNNHPDEQTFTDPVLEPTGTVGRSSGRKGRGRVAKGHGPTTEGLTVRTSCSEIVWDYDSRVRS